jgi:HSF-type DNA-binding
MMSKDSVSHDPILPATGKSHHRIDNKASGEEGGGKEASDEESSLKLVVARRQFCSLTRVKIDLFFFQPEDAATVVGKLDANKDGASPASAIASPDKIKAVDDSVASVKKAAAVATAASSDVLLVDDIEGSEELQLSFPERLMSLLRNNNTDGIGGGKQAADITKAMRWLPGGEAFLIVPNIFYDVVLDGYFHGTKFESFTRKLNRW